MLPHLWSSFMFSAKGGPKMSSAAPNTANTAAINAAQNLVEPIYFGKADFDCEHSKMTELHAEHRASTCISIVHLVPLQT